MTELHPYDQWVLVRAEELRNSQTPHERKIAEAFRRWFRRKNIRVVQQVPILNYIVDFFFPDFGLAVELDGKHHDPTKDSQRDADLCKWSVRVLRFPNPQDTIEINAIVFRVYAELRYMRGRKKRLENRKKSTNPHAS